MPEPAGTWLVVGLGNPGPAYARTRHNVGQMVLDVLAARQQSSQQPSRQPSWRGDRSGRADVVAGRLGDPPGVRAVLARPRSYMNESGGPVSTLLSFYQVSLEQLVVVHDELDLPYGTLRVKVGGGDNGHNGLRSLRRSLATGDFCRVRIGVGRPQGRQDAADFVLAPFTTVERADLDLQLQIAADAVESLVSVGLAHTQSRFNG